MFRMFGIALMLICSGCARLDHIQINDIDQSQGRLKPISVQVSNTGFDAAGVVDISRDLTQSLNAKEDLEDLALILTLINMGPSTGNPVYSDKYAENILALLQKQCSSNRITAIRNVREANAYGPISGEVVRIDADCIL